MRKYIDTRIVNSFQFVPSFLQTSSRLKLREHAVRLKTTRRGNHSTRVTRGNFHDTFGRAREGEERKHRRLSLLAVRSFQPFEPRELSALKKNTHPSGNQSDTS